MSDGDKGRSATLGDVAGSGYAVVESLASLGKGRRLTGLFRAPAAAAERLRAEAAAHRRVRFRGPVHFRHHSATAEMEVELVRAEEEAGGLLVEFVAWDVPYDLG